MVQTVSVKRRWKKHDDNTQEAPENILAWMEANRG